MGFICPECKIAFGSDLLLMTHYRSKHDTPALNSNKWISENEEICERMTNKEADVKKDTKSNFGMVDVHEAYLSALAPSLEELKHASLAMGYALDTQNKQLDRIDDKVDRTNDDMRIVALQSKRLLGSKTDHPIYSFRCALQELSTKAFLQDVGGEPLLRYECWPVYQCQFHESVLVLMLFQMAAPFGHFPWILRLTCGDSKVSYQVLFWVSIDSDT